MSGDDILDVFDVELFAEVYHAAGFQLEHRHRLAAIQQIEDILVVERDVVDVKIGLLFADQSLRVADDRERFQPEKIHLQHAQIGERLPWSTGSRFRRRCARERDVIAQIAIS